MLRYRQLCRLCNLPSKHSCDGAIELTMNDLTAQRVVVDSITHLPQPAITRQSYLCCEAPSISSEHSECRVRDPFTSRNPSNLLYMDGNTSWRKNTNGKALDRSNNLVMLARQKSQRLILIYAMAEHVRN
ncbi:hypothetical protein J6590_003539 [Homalodisca vitripennis]|nr:hypothetical protein J6590_003539 [Homalodisca vitripennis]